MLMSLERKLFSLLNYIFKYFLHLKGGLMKFPVFMYHAFSIGNIEPDDADLHYSISLDEFKKHIDICIDEGFEVISLLDYSNDKNSHLNKKICCFTFDDGHVSNFAAAKLLAHHGFSADFFINTSVVGRENFLTPDMLIKMKEMGMSIQTHGHEHKYFSELSDDELSFQFEYTQKDLESLLGYKATIFAPPGGRVNAKVIKFARFSGIKLISNSRPGLMVVGGNPYNVPRLPVLFSTDSNCFYDLLNNSNNVILKLKLKYYTAKLLKMILGNNNYEKFRLLILRS